MEPAELPGVVLRAPQPLPCWLPVVAWRKITVDLCFFGGVPWGITSWMVYFMEKRIEMNDLGVPPHGLETSGICGQRQNGQETMNCGCYINKKTL